VTTVRLVAALAVLVFRRDLAKDAELLIDHARVDQRAGRHHLPHGLAVCLPSLSSTRSCPPTGSNGGPNATAPLGLSRTAARTL
jgi:hypothetical protein